MPVTKFSSEVEDDLLSNQSEHELQAIMRGDKRLNSKPKYYLMNFGKACQCANKSYFCISADGKLSKCEQAYDNNYESIGHISQDGDFFTHERLQISP